jgi:Arc/MetJ-type ribon-helix-helix transcriptional regulator
MERGTVQVAFRLPVELVAKLDEAAAAAKGFPGVRVTRSDVVRALLVDALARRVVP